MLYLLSALRSRVAIAFVGGSDLAKQQEQLGTASVPVTSLFDYCFAENGLTAYRLGEALARDSFIAWIGEARYKELVRFVLHYIADLDLPIKRGTFIEFRNGMINVSPVGRNASVQERHDYEKYDKEHGVRKTMVEALEKAFPDLDLKYAYIYLPQNKPRRPYFATYRTQSAAKTNHVMPLMGRCWESVGIQ